MNRVRSHGFRTNTDKQTVFHLKFLHNAAESSEAVTSLDMISSLYDQHILINWNGRFMTQ